MTCPTCGAPITDVRVSVRHGRMVENGPAVNESYARVGPCGHKLAEPQAVAAAGALLAAHFARQRLRETSGQWTPAQHDDYDPYCTCPTCLE